MTTSRPSRSARAALGAVVGLLVGAAAALGVSYYLGYLQPKPSPKPSASDTNAYVVALGRIEPAGGVLDIVAPVGDRVLTIGDIDEKAENVSPPPKQAKSLKELRERDTVQIGDVLFVLESWRDRRREHELAQAQVADAEKQLKELQANGEKQIAVAEAKLKQAEKALDTEPKALTSSVQMLEKALVLERKQFDAMAASGGGNVPTLQIDAQRLKVEKAATDLDSAKTQLEIAQQNGPLNHKVAKAQAELVQSEVSLARMKAESGLEAAKQRLKLAELHLERTKVRAPRTGVLVKLAAQPGEAVGPRPLAQLADTSAMFVVTEVYETDVQRLRDGLGSSSDSLEVKVVSRALAPGDKYDKINPMNSIGALAGTLRRDDIGTQIARNRVFDLNPAADVDRRVVEVRVRLDAAAAPKAALYLGHQVTVYFKLH